jgi:hypothetical protein
MINATKDLLRYSGVSSALLTTCTDFMIRAIKTLHMDSQQATTLADEVQKIRDELGELIGEKYESNMNQQEITALVVAFQEPTMVKFLQITYNLSKNREFIQKEVFEKLRLLEEKYFHLDSGVTP